MSSTRRATPTWTDSSRSRSFQLTRWPDRDRRQRFAQEAKTASALNHPGIVTIHDILQHEGIDFIAMEFVPGRTLDRVIPRHGLGLNETLDYGVQIADALPRRTLPVSCTAT